MVNLTATTSTVSAVQPSLNVSLDSLYASDAIRGAGCLSLAINTLSGIVSAAVVTSDSLDAAASDDNL